LTGLQWKFPTKGPVRSSPVVAGDLVIFGSGDGNLYAVQATTGRERWRQPLGGAVASTPAVADGLVVATAREHVVRAVDLQTGRPRWKFETGADRPFEWGWDFWLSSPTISATTVYVGSGDGNVYALELSTGRKLWQFPTGGRVRSTPAVDQGVVYVGSMDGKLYALDAATGKIKWMYSPPPPAPPAGTPAPDPAAPPRPARPSRNSAFSTAPAVIDGAVIAGALDGSLYVIDASDGKLLWSYQTAKAYPDAIGVPGKGGSIDANAITAANGMLLVTSGYGQFGEIPGNVLLAFKPK
jgi:outer membrane protein assembly factor BamB